MSSKSSLAGLCLVVCLLLSVSALGQEVEPNDGCQQAQDVGSAVLPFLIFGNLDSSSSPDIDFFRFSAEPETMLEVNLEGAPTDQGTLADPFMAVLDSSCQPIFFDDDGGFYLNSRLVFPVPSDGIFTIAATICCDFALLGGGEGSYLLTVDRLRGIGSIQARLVDSRNGQPLSGGFPTFGRADLYYCQGGDCTDQQASVSADEQGQVFFPNDLGFANLRPGTYRITAFANAFQPALTPLFEVAEGEEADRGDIELDPLALIGTLSGRLVDALDGHPLPGAGPPFSSVNLFKCDEFGCFGARFGSVDDQGRFRFMGIEDPTFLNPGRYWILARADQYFDLETDFFEIGEGQDLDLEDLRLRPRPLQILEVHPCGNLPAQGGTCRFSVDVRNGSPTRFNGEAWSLVLAFGLDDEGLTSQFQVGRSGRNNPLPQSVNIRSGAVQSIAFQVEVPGTVAPVALICPTFTVGANPSPQFNPVTPSTGALFCVIKSQQGPFSVLSEKESRKLMKERQRQDGR